MIVLCITTGILFTLLYRYYYMIPLMASGLLLLWMYSYRPFKLSYRGGGELLQTAGTGFGLPLLGYYAQSGNLSSFPWIVLLIILPTSLSCAIATALPDRPADVHYSKRTFPVLVGLSRAKITIFILNIMSIVAAFVIIHPLNSRFLDYSIRLLHVGAFVGLILFRKALPGTLKITAFVSMAVITTLSLIAGVTLSMFGC